MMVSKFRRASRNGVRLRCILRHTYDLHIGLRYLREHACCWFRDIKRPYFIGRPWRHHQRLPIQFINNSPNQQGSNSLNFLGQNNRKLDHSYSAARWQSTSLWRSIMLYCSMHENRSSSASFWLFSNNNAAKNIRRSQMSEVILTAVRVAPNVLLETVFIGINHRLPNQNYMDTTIL